MKTLILFLFIFAIPIMAQDNPRHDDENETGWLRDFSTDGTTVTKTTIYNRAYADATLDTTEAINLIHHKTIYVSVQSKDSASIHIKYQLSVDGETWGVIATKDSLSTAAGDFKSVDFTSTTLGASYVRFHFDVQAWLLGTTSATYSAAYTVKKQ